MTGDNQQRASNESVRPRRKGNEQAIKDFVVIIGSVMMIMCFGLLLEVNIRGWHELGQKKLAIFLFALLCLVSTLFAFYIFCRLRKSCRQCDIEQNVAGSNTQNEISHNIDQPPSYATAIMGSPPPTYNSLKIPQETAIANIDDEFVVTHI